MIRRRGRPGLLGTAARTAVIAGTATSVSGKVAAKQQAELAAARAQAQQAALDDAAARAVAAQQAVAPAAPVAAAPVASAPAAAEAVDPLAQLERLAALHEKGLLSAEEFTAAKAKLLGL